MDWRDFLHRREDEQRRHERFEAKADVSCALGAISDLSFSGLKLTCRGKPPRRPGRLQSLTLDSPAGSVTLSARIVRVEPLDRKTYELGMEFVSLTPTDRAFLVQAMRCEGASNSRPASDRPHRVAPAIDYYKVLGVPHDATLDAIRAAYRRLALQSHPDATHGETARQFQRVHEAYETLIDPGKRREHDAALGLTSPSLP